MTFATTIKRVLGILFVIVLMFNPTVSAEETETDFTQDKNPLATTQPASQTKPIEKPAKEKEQQEQQTASSSKSEAPTAASSQEGQEQESSAGEDKASEACSGEEMVKGTVAPHSTEEAGESDSAEENPGEASAPTTVEETLPPQTLPPEDMPIWISLEWELSSEDRLLCAGDSITLVAKITTEAEDFQLQWQVASKPASALAENEAEWEDVSGANEEKYAFTVQENMLPWRLRLRVTLPNGEAVYSSEISLPKISAGGDELASGEEDESFSASDTALPLPIAAITLTANIPLEEIVYGDEVTLVANIHNPRDGMLLQWQHMPVDTETTENAWESMEGANENSYIYVVSEENVEWIWRLLITVPEGIAEPEDEISVAEHESASGEETDLEVPPEQPASDASESKSPAQESTLDTTEAQPEESLAETAEIIETTEE